MRDNTLLINHANGYVQMLLSFSEGMATLEFFTLNPNDLPNLTNPNRRSRTPPTPGKQLAFRSDGWKRKSPSKTSPLFQHLASSPAPTARTPEKKRAQQGKTRPPYFYDSTGHEWGVCCPLCTSNYLELGPDTEFQVKANQPTPDQIPPDCD